MIPVKNEYSILEVAQIVGMKVSEIQRLCADGEIKATLNKLTMTWKISQEELKIFMEGRGQNTSMFTRVEQPAGRMLSVLVVDDDPSVVGFIRKAILKLLEGVNVEFTDNSYSALSLLLQNTPDLLILDAMLPGMNGAQLLREIRGNDRIAYIKILAISGYPESLQEMKDFGVDDALAKPFKAQELIDKVGFLLNLKSGEAGRPSVTH